MIRRTSVVLLVMACAGCQVFPPINVGSPQRAMPSYGELVARYNRNIARLDRMWSRATVEVRWVENNGKKRSEQGNESQLMVVGRDRLALSVGKLGKTAFWIGCDSMRYWWIDTLDDPIAYVGWHDKLYRGESQPLPVDIRPLDLPMLMGLTPLDPDAVPQKQPHVARYQGLYIIEPPGANARLTLDPRTALPVRVEIFDRTTGKPVIASRLSQPERVELHGAAPGAWPLIMSRAELTVPQREGWMRIHLRNMTDARAPIHERRDLAMQRAFDFDYLVKALIVQQVIPLDRTP